MGKAHPSFPLIYQSQMTTPNMPFIITLTKSDRGYLFQQVQQVVCSNPKLKKPKTPITKNSNSKITNRLIKQIGLISDHFSFEKQENIVSQPALPTHNDEYEKNDAKSQSSEEQIEYDVKRNTELPQIPAKWFSIEDIHIIERQHFPEFFESKTYKTADLYLSYRNFMVEAYQKNSLRYLTFISCRRVLKGDVNCLMKIYKFLNRKGIINFCLNYQGNFNFNPSILDKSKQMSQKPQNCIKKLPQESQEETKIEIDTDSLTLSAINKNFSRSYRVYCKKCGLITGVVWYVHEVSNDSVCFDCFHALNKEESKQYQKTDLVKKMQSLKDNKSHKGNWNIEDNLKLLNFMSNSKGKTWDELVDCFQGKKFKEDIILQFMQFPITNYDPNERQQTKKEAELESIKEEESEEELLIEKFYQNSEYCRQSIKFEEKIEEERSNEGNFQRIIKNVIYKYSEKINHLKKMEELNSFRNLAINQQPVSNRMKMPKYSEKISQVSNSSEVLEN